MIRLNVGSGQRKFGGDFVNIDINQKWEPDVVADAVNLPYEDNSVDMIVLHHCAEHMTLGHSAQCFAEAFRVLKTGGSMLVFVPDLATLVHAWMISRIDDYIFAVNLHGAFMNSEADIHRWSFTTQALKKHIQKSADWQKVKPFDWRQIENADIAKDFWIQGAEAVK